MSVSMKLSTPARVEARSACVRPTARKQEVGHSRTQQVAGALLASVAAVQLAVLPLAGSAVASALPTQEVAVLAEGTTNPESKNLGPNEVSAELIGEFPNASEKDKAAPGRSGTTFSNPSKDTGALTSTEGVGKATVANTKEAAKEGLSGFFNIFNKK